MEEEEASSSDGDFESKKQARSRKRRESHAEALQEGGQELGGVGDGGTLAGAKKRRKRSLQDGYSSAPGKRGVVYLSRIPPHMKPLKLRHLLEPFGQVLRIYLAPEGEVLCVS